MGATHRHAVGTSRQGRAINTIITLIVLKQVLKYAAEYLDLSEEDMMYVPVDDFDDGVEGINY